MPQGGGGRQRAQVLGNVSVLRARDDSGLAILILPECIGSDKKHGPIFCIDRTERHCYNPETGTLFFAPSRSGLRQLAGRGDCPEPRVGPGARVSAPKEVVMR